LKTADKWILTKLNKLINNVNSQINNCKFHEASRLIEEFVISSLSQTYVPLIRYDLWNDEIENKLRRFSIYTVLSVCLKNVDDLLHPLCPYTTDFLYLSCFKRCESILMDGWSNKEILEKISNDELEYAFDVVRDITSISFSIRNKSKIKRRWPLESAFIYCPNTMFLKIPEIREILHEQLNIQNLIIEQLSYENNIEKIIKLFIIPKTD